VPPGACPNRAAAAGVSTHDSRCFLRSLKISVELSLPTETVVSPPTGREAAVSARPSTPSSSLPMGIDALPPGACENRGAAVGVSKSDSRCSLRSAKTSFTLSVPTEMVVSPPTGPLVTGASSSPSPPSTTLETPPTGPFTTSISAASPSSAHLPPRAIEVLPPGSCEKRGGGAGVSISASHRFSFA